MRRRELISVKRNEDVFEEITQSTDWVVPSGVRSVDVFIVAGGQDGERSTPYEPGDGGNGGQCVNLFDFQVEPFAVIPIVVGGRNQDSSFGDNVSVSGGGSKGGHADKTENGTPSNGRAGNSGIRPFGGRYNDVFPNFYGAGGGSGCLVRGWDRGDFTGGRGGKTGGGNGADDDDKKGTIDNGNVGGDATYFGAGGGGASRAKGIGSTGKRGGYGYQGIVIIHYLK